MADRRRRRTARRRRAFVLGLALAVVAAGAGTAWAMSGPDGPSYRLATVTRSDVRQTVDADGTLSAHNRATLSFPASGTVQSVKVAVGDRVAAGQVVATLDPTQLQAAVTSAEQAVAQAQQRLAADEDAQAIGTSSTATSSSGTHGTSSFGAVRLTNVRSALPSGHPSGSSAASSSGRSGIAAAQHGVVTAQHALDAAVSAVNGDLQHATSACGAVGSASATGDHGTVGSDGTVTGSASGAGLVLLFDATHNSVVWQSPDATGSYTFSGLAAGDDYTVVLVSTQSGTCGNAVDAATRDQRAVANAEHALSAAIDALNKAVATPSTGASSGSAPASSNRSGTANRSSGTGNSSSAQSSPAGTGGTVTSEQIAADSKDVDAAEAALAVARHDVGYATLTSPIAGTVGAVSIAAGNPVSASSTTATVVVVGSGALSAQVDIGLSDIDLVKLGQDAQVTVDGRTSPLAAKVTYVGAQNASSSTGGSAAYPVTVTLNAADPKLFDGMGASVAIDVGTARDVLTVPVSAVHTVGTFHTVTTYAHGTATTKPVTLGVSGDVRVQVVSGLAPGDRVVLADVGAAVPTSTTGTGGGGLARLTGGAGLGGGGGGLGRRFGR